MINRKYKGIILYTNGDTPSPGRERGNLEYVAEFSPGRTLTITPVDENSRRVLWFAYPYIDFEDRMFDEEMFLLAIRIGQEEMRQFDQRFCK